MDNVYLKSRRRAIKMSNRNGNVIAVDFAAERQRRRRFPREKCFIKVRLSNAVDDADKARFEDISSVGGCVITDRARDLPETFELFGFREGKPVLCRKVWAAGNRAGVEFVERIDR